MPNSGHLCRDNNIMQSQAVSSMQLNGGADLRESPSNCIFTVCELVYIIRGWSLPFSSAPDM